MSDMDRTSMETVPTLCSLLDFTHFWHADAESRVKRTVTWHCRNGHLRQKLKHLWRPWNVSTENSVFNHSIAFVPPKQ